MTNKEKILALFKEFENPDKKQGLKNILSMMSEDVVWTTQGPSDLIPFAGIHKGKAGVKNMFETQHSVLMKPQFPEDPQIIGGDDETTQVIYMPIESVKLKNSQSEYHTAFAMILSFNSDGLVSSVMSLFDTYAVAKAFEC